MWKYGMNMDQVVENAKADLIALQEGGVDGIIFSDDFSFPYQRNTDKVIPLEIMTDKYNQYFINTEDFKNIVASSKKTVWLLLKQTIAHSISNIRSDM
ncbi:MAG: hypothetical protein IJ115_07520 [Erysipelotrichaceae bacterium]|nr:hypothetical protein [Erysipelotrichaceae bacterium]